MEPAEKLKGSSIRSRAYPAISLEDAIKRISNLAKNVGYGSYQRDIVAKGIGYTSISGASTRSVAALVQYGLLDSGRDHYSLSSLAKQYLMPTTEDAQSTALQSAALFPSLFKEIYEENRGRTLPKQLPNILATSKGISPKVSETVADILIKTLTFSGLVDPFDGKLIGLGTVNLPLEGVDDQKSSRMIQGEPEIAQASKGLPIIGTGQAVQLPSGAMIVFPEEASYALAVGEFATEIKNLNAKIDEVLNATPGQD